MSKSLVVKTCIGKILKVNPGKTAIVYRKILPEKIIAFTAKQSIDQGTVGTIEYYTTFKLNVSEDLIGLWWYLEGGYWCKHEPGVFNTAYLVKQGAKTIETYNKEQEEAEKERLRKEKEANMTFGDKALNTIKNITLFSLGGWLLYTFINNKTKNN